MLALLIYCYANRIMASRRIEQATYPNVCVRFVAVNTHPDRRAHDLRPASPEKPQREIKASWMKEMKAQLATEAGKEKYRNCKQTVEPVFGIIKHAMKFRQFLLRGIDKVRGEWSLVALAYNCRRLHTLVRAGAG